MTTITSPLHSQLVKATCFLLVLLPLVDMIDEQQARTGGGRKRAILLDTGQVVQQKMDNNGTISPTAAVVGHHVTSGGTLGTTSFGDAGTPIWQDLSPTLTAVHGGPSPSLLPWSSSSSGVDLLSPSSSSAFVPSTRAYSGETTHGGGGHFSLTSFMPTSTSKRHRHGSSSTMFMTTVISSTMPASLLSSASTTLQHSPQQQHSLHKNEDKNKEQLKEKVLSHHQKKSSLSVEPPVSLAVSSSSSSSSSRNSGPYFESNKTTISVSAREGQTVMLDCAVALLQGRTVSWLRRRKDSLTLLTVGNATYQQDTRVGLKFRYPNNWRLGIDQVHKGDEGEWICQLSTHPIKTLIYHLKVIAPAVIILDENGQTKTERHYKVDSSLHLTCKSSHVDKGTENKVTWLKDGRALPLSDKRIKVRFEKNPNNGEVSAYLSVSSVHKADSGNYSCRGSSMATSTIVVHVLNGELPAAVQHESCANNRLPLSSGLQLALALAVTTLMMRTTTSSPSASILSLLPEQLTR